MDSIFNTNKVGISEAQGLEPAAKRRFQITFSLNKQDDAAKAAANVAIRFKLHASVDGVIFEEVTTEQTLTKDADATRATGRVDLEDQLFNQYKFEITGIDNAPLGLAVVSVATAAY